MALFRVHLHFRHRNQFSLDVSSSFRAIEFHRFWCQKQTHRVHLPLAEVTQEQLTFSLIKILLFFLIARVEPCNFMGLSPPSLGHLKFWWERRNNEKKWGGELSIDVKLYGFLFQGLKPYRSCSPKHVKLNLASWSQSGLCSYATAVKVSLGIFSPK